MSVEPFNRLVKLAARAFYDDITTKADNQPKLARNDNKGIAVVVLDALTRRQWVREEDLAKDLKLHSKQLRRTLRFFEEEKFVTRDHRKETAKGAKVHSAAVAATADSQTVKEGDEKIKLHTHSYCCLDYAQIYDVIRYRLHRMRKKMKDELENKDTIQEYICPNCGRRYNALDALRLISFEDDYFHCENCNGELVAESDKLDAEEGDGDDNAKRRRHEKLKDMLSKMEVQLKPIMDQLSRVKDLPIPEFGSLQAWEARASAAMRATNGDFSSNDLYKSSEGIGYGGTPMPFIGETKVEVAFPGLEPKEEDGKGEAASTLKVLPPWMIKQGMNITKEQRGVVKQESKLNGCSTTPADLDDKKMATEYDEQKNIQDEYVKAYYAAMVKKQQELEEAANKERQLSYSSNGLHESPTRHVGMKAKREDYDDNDDGDQNDDDHDDDGDGFAWEDAPIEGHSSKSYQISDLNQEAGALGDEEEDDDDIDWEEG